MAGCKGNPHCTHCHNPETWRFDQGDLYNEVYFEKIKTKINDFDKLIGSIQIFGGEINDQNYIELEKMLRDLKTLNRPIWLFTRYDLDECPKFELELCDYIKTGRYVPELSCENNIQFGVTLATSNQRIHKKGVNY